AGLFLVFIVLLAGCQRSLIYFPRRYVANAATDPILESQFDKIRYRTSQGEQTALYVPPKGRAADRPERVWACFGGNASVALAWLDMALEAPDPDVAFLLIDYPGYGFNEGKPTRATITDGADAALTALAERLGIARAQLDRQVSLIGHSLGAAVALELAVKVQ